MYMIATHTEKGNLFTAIMDLILLSTGIAISTHSETMVNLGILLAVKLTHKINHYRHIAFRYKEEN